MEFSNPVLIWAGIGVVLMLAEVIVPGGIVILLGASCLLVSGALALGLVDGFVQSMTLWFIASMVLLLGFRHITQRVVGGDSHVDNTDEALDIYNQTALVKADIGPGEKAGRVEFQGADWPALGDGSLIPSGTQVRVICRENISLIVEALPAQHNV
ncbi:NfeD family protein [Shewanella litorisediminis]|uniref:NfeD family protein n=1 Tax=Shewanella litorisediminis TaxID=1173586 RepID=A0ABX7G4M5_9GAMM|nr:NfeD family protein [Shewanella litorisediminis]MCL2917775.1 NfeD family protein [Shewanella litorisediminis]QRH02218.1 NfeD family protein [Shewanella litorisediminis]